MPESIDRAWPQQVHAEVHAVQALRRAYDRALQARNVDEVLTDLLHDIGERTSRLRLRPDAICDALELDQRWLNLTGGIAP